MADKRQPEIAACFLNSGFVVYPSVVDYYSKEKREKINTEGVAPGNYQKGVADLSIAKNEKSALVEVKNGNKGFAFSDWREEQRSWAEMVEKEKRVPYFIALVVGDSRPDLKNGRDDLRPRKAWVIPRKYFLAVEYMVSKYQKSIPYRVLRNTPVEMRDANLDAITLFQQYELKWEKGGWHIPQNHKISTYFEMNSETIQLRSATTTN